MRWLVAVMAVLLTTSCVARQERSAPPSTVTSTTTTTTTTQPVAPAPEVGAAFDAVAAPYLPITPELCGPVTSLGADGPCAPELSAVRDVAIGVRASLGGSTDPLYANLVATATQVEQAYAGWLAVPCDHLDPFNRPEGTTPDGYLAEMLPRCATAADLVTEAWDQFYDEVQFLRGT